MPLVDFEFNPPTGLRDTTEYDTTPASEAAARGQIQGVSDQIKDYINTVLHPEISAGGVDDLGITTQKLADSAVTTSKLADDAVTNQKINIDHAVTAANGNDINVYPDGVSHSSISTSNKTQVTGENFPVDGTLLTTRNSTTKTFQLLVEANGNKIYTRSYYSDAWKPWKKIQEWVEIITDHLLGVFGSVSTTAHMGYSEMMVQLKDSTGNSGTVRGSVVVPLMSDGTSKGIPKILVTDINGSLHGRAVIPEVGGINYHTTTATDTQYLSVFVR